MHVLSKKAVDARVQTFVASCRARGEKATTQRLGVYRAVVASAGHPSPEEVFQELRSGMPTLSLATVYKSLDFLEELGFIRRVAVVGESRRYDGNLSPHSHLVCRQCRSVTDFVEVELARAMAGHDELGGFRAEDVSVQIIGTCECCQQAGLASSSPSAIGAP